MMMNRIEKFVTAFFLWVYLPFAIANLMEENKKKSIAIFIALVGLTLFCFCHKSHKNIDIIDLTPAFSNNNVRKHTCEYIVIHHAGGDGVINDVVNVHFREHQWHSLGYHYMVDKEGKVYQLRNDNENCPHSLYYNDNAIAILLMGNFNEKEPTKEQWKSALALTVLLQKKYNISTENVKGHKELEGNVTDCPGKMFNLDKFRNEL